MGQPTIWDTYHFLKPWMPLCLFLYQFFFPFVPKEGVKWITSETSISYGLENSLLTQTIKCITSIGLCESNWKTDTEKQKFVKYL